MAPSGSGVGFHLPKDQATDSMEGIDNARLESNRGTVHPPHPRGSSASARSLSRGRSRSRGGRSNAPRKGNLTHSKLPTNKGKAKMAEAQPSPSRSKESAPKQNSQMPMRSRAAVARSSTKGYDLTFVPPLVVDINEDVLSACDPKWTNCLVGYFIGKKLPFKLVEAALKHMWGAYLEEILANDEGFYFFHIPDADYRKKILDNGCFTVAKVPLILQQFHPLMDLQRARHKAVSAGVGLPEVIEVDMMDDIRTVKVEYEWRPSYCPTCICFGHKCPAATEHQVKSPVVSPPRTTSPVQSSSPQQPLDETWIEISSRRRSSNQQPVAPTRPEYNQNQENPPAQNRSKLTSSPPQPTLARFLVLEKEHDDDSKEHDLEHSEEDIEEPLFVKSSLPPEVDPPLLEPECIEAVIPPLEPVCPAAPARNNRRGGHSNKQVLGLPSSSNTDLKLGDPSIKQTTCAHRSSSVSEEFSHDDEVNSQDLIAMVSVPSEMTHTERAAPPTQVRGTRSSKGNRSTQPPQPGPQSGGTNNASLPQHSLKSSKSRKSGR